MSRFSLSTSTVASLAMLTALAAAPGSAAQAQTAGYPERNITVVVPFPPGGASDSTARLLAGKMQEALGKPVVIDNRPGANGSAGAGHVKQSAPDGYTLLVGSIGVYAINPALFPNLNYDPAKDFDLLTVAVRTPNALVAHPDFPANTIAELVDYLKKNPNKVTFASSGSGSSDHLTAELFWQKTGTDGIHVPYKGGGPAIGDLIGGHADVSFQNLGAVANHIKAGKLKVLAVTAEARNPVFPDVPTMKEAGVDGLEVYSWQAAAAPKGLPADVKARLATEMQAALNDPAITAKFNEIGFEVVANSPEDFTKFQAAEEARWRAVVKAGNVATQ
ncbi:tripartite tricarboxylate transporter substrate binding protein [Ancylobacter sp. A5.8]|uniref:Bug family tripartite tricarboxylate transporter substrate binding protein n=1 Tax=Ancylobacter gelatini TaxID=2919920 RepID=UPI001F4E1EAE|nr:tripartite tricarboxylate transporter substrate binding protein [Ancylobacter gelatini]MCJ8142534.1 tripartite tricarboxylate transporter substrate binding protein [Ancylobacter gelatini]